MAQEALTPEAKPQVKPLTLHVICWNCKRLIGAVTVAEDLLAIEKPKEGEPFTDRMTVSMLNGLFGALTKAIPSANGLHCPECHVKLTAEAKGRIKT